MTCYVDYPIHNFGRMKMCHLWADGYGSFLIPNIVDELHWMVDKIGVERKWIQGHAVLSLPKARNASWLHFDIAKHKRKLAIIHGAIACDRFACLDHSAQVMLRLNVPELTTIALKRLARVASVRAKRETDSE